MRKDRPYYASGCLRNARNHTVMGLLNFVESEFRFSSAKKGSPCVELKISTDSRIIINDGQHRRAAIEAALNVCPSLRYEGIAVVMAPELCKQMFANLNRRAI